MFEMIIHESLELNLGERFVFVFTESWNYMVMTLNGVSRCFHITV